MTYPKNFKENTIAFNTTSKILLKRALQKLLKALKDDGCEVVKLDCGYAVYVDHPTSNDKILVLKAMIGAQSYLVRMAEDLLV